LLLNGKICGELIAQVSRLHTVDKETSAPQCANSFYKVVEPSTSPDRPACIRLKQSLLIGIALVLESLADVLRLSISFLVEPKQLCHGHF